MPIFEENIHFKLPGLGSAEKDTPGSFRADTPLYKVNGDPEPEVSTELQELVQAHENAELSKAHALKAKAFADANRIDFKKKLTKAL